MTEPVYLWNGNLFETTAVVMSEGIDPRGKFVVLDRTLFYPQGGGQPADQGVIQIKDDCCQVIDVRYEGSEIRHYIQIDAMHLKMGSIATLAVNQARRLLNARYHTAGHLIAAIAEKLSLGDLTAIKGHHFPGEGYVEFQGMLENTELFQVQLQCALNQSIGSGGIVETIDWNVDAGAQMLDKRQYKINTENKVRVCLIQGFEPIPCGGTHVRRLEQIGSVYLIKYKCKKGKMRISYEL
jgi:alanyl-tRNA synthetase